MESLGGAAKGRMWAALTKTFKKAFPGAHIDKVGFAKEVVDYLDRERLAEPRPAAVAELEYNFASLIRELASKLNLASAEEAERRTNRQTKRAVRGFLRDHPDSSTRDEASQLLREVESLLEDTPGDEAVQVELIALQRDFELNSDPLRNLENFAEFRDRLEGLDARRRIGYRQSASDSSSAQAA